MFCTNGQKHLMWIVFVGFQNVTLLIGNPMDFAKDIELLKSLKKSPVSHCTGSSILILLSLCTFLSWFRWKNVCLYNDPWETVWPSRHGQCSIFWAMITVTVVKLYMLLLLVYSEDRMLYLSCVRKLVHQHTHENIPTKIFISPNTSQHQYYHLTFEKINLNLTTSSLKYDQNTRECWFWLYNTKQAYVFSGNTYLKQQTDR